MNKYKPSLWLVLFLGLYGCSEDIMNKINDDPYHAEDVPAKLFWPMIHSSVFIMWGRFVILLYISNTKWERIINCTGRTFDGEPMLASLSIMLKILCNAENAKIAVKNVRRGLRR